MQVQVRKLTILKWTVKIRSTNWDLNWRIRKIRISFGTKQNVQRYFRGHMKSQCALPDDVWSIFLWPFFNHDKKKGFFRPEFCDLTQSQTFQRTHKKFQQTTYEMKAYILMVLIFILNNWIFYTKGVVTSSIRDTWNCLNDSRFLYQAYQDQEHESWISFNKIS